MKKDWEIKKLGEVCEYFNDGNWIESKDQSEDGIRLIQTGNIGNGIFHDKGERARFISEETFNSLNCTEVFPNDVLISRLPDPIGRACIIPNIGIKMITAVDCTIARFNSTTLNSFFVYYSKSNGYSNKINKYSTGTTRKRISRANLAKIPIPIPPLLVQQSIVAELDTLHRLKELQEQQLAEYDNLAQSTFCAMFGDPIENEKGWEVKKLGEVCEIISGTTPKTSELTYWNGDVKWITPAEIGEDVFYLYDTIRKITQKAVNETGLKSFPKDTVILSSRAPIGKVAIAGTKMYCNQGFKNFICNNKRINHIFLFYFLKLNSAFLNSLGRGATFKEISKTIVEGISIGLPPISLQTQFAERIEKIEAQKEMVKQSIAQTRQLIDYTMDKYFE